MFFQNLPKTFHNQKTPYLLSLAAVYWFWGSAFLAIKISLSVFPPIILMGLRFTIAGLVLVIFCFFSNRARISKRNFCIAVISGILLIGSNTVVAFSQQYIPSGAVAAFLALVPLWMTLFAMLKPSSLYQKRWRPLIIAFSGVFLLTWRFNGTTHIEPIAALFMGTLIWAGTSLWLSRVKLPTGNLVSAIQMCSGGFGVLLFGLRMEKIAIPHLTNETIFSMLYLIVGCSIIAFRAYNYLLQHTDPAIASSYSFVCPVVATSLGFIFLNERLNWTSAVALILIVVGLFDLFFSKVIRTKGLALFQQIQFFNKKI